MGSSFRVNALGRSAAALTLIGVGFLACSSRDDLDSTRSSDAGDIDSPDAALVAPTSNDAEVATEDAASGGGLTRRLARMKDDPRLDEPSLIHGSQEVRSLTCPFVALDATATNATAHNDSWDAGSTGSFTIPTTLAIRAGTSTNYLATLSFSTPRTGLPAVAVNCAYNGSSGTFTIVACTPSMTPLGAPQGGAAWSAETFGLSLVAINPTATSSVEAHVELGSVDGDDGNVCTSDACGSHGGATHTSVANGTPCPNNTVCDGAETCVSGVCTSGTPPDCYVSGQCIAGFGCDPVSGCYVQQASAGSPCDDQLWCDGNNDQCDSTGHCLPGGTPPCPTYPADSCLIGRCFESPFGGSGTCRTDAKSDGTTCGFSDPCVGTPGTCSQGFCTGSVPRDCSSNNPCVTDSCQSGVGCVHTPKSAGTSCSDGQYCDGQESCDGAGHCASGVPPQIDDGNPCTVDTCDNDGVHHTPAAAGTVCSDGNVCHSSGTCDGAGTCTGIGAADCNSHDACYVDSCDPAVGCVHTPATAGTSCSDGDLCSGGASAQCDGSGSCVRGSPPTIDDGDACTADACQATLGVTHTPIPNCSPQPVAGEAPFETRASLLGKLVNQSGGAITGATFTVSDAPAPGSFAGGATRNDVVVSTAGDGSFRLRLSAFATAEPDRSPPKHVLLRIDASGVLPAYRDAWLHTGTALDLGVIKMVVRDSAVTNIGPAGGVATDSQNKIRVTIPEGALRSTIGIRITPFATRDEFPAPLPDDSSTTYGFELEPSGTQFLQPVSVAVSNTLNVPASLTIPTGYYDVATGRWEHEASATWDNASQRFVFQTTHFSPYDCNFNRGGQPGAAPNHGPNDPPVCDNCPCPQPETPDNPAPNPGDHTGSSASLVAGTLHDSLKLPTYRVRDEDVGVTLAYDSGFAASRTIGAAPSDYSAIAHDSLSVPLRPLRMTAVSIPAGVDRSQPAVQPGACPSFLPSTGLGQGSGTPLVFTQAMGGSTSTETVTVGGANAQADTMAFFHLPLVNGQPASTGFFSARLSATAVTSTSCVSSGGTFGVSNEQGALTQVSLQPGPLATFDRRVLVAHRASSAYGAGWSIEGMARIYRAGGVAYRVGSNGRTEVFRPRAFDVPVTGDYPVHVVARDPQTGELLLARKDGVIARMDPISGASTAVLSGLPFGAGVQGFAVTYVGSARRFLAWVDTQLLEIDAAGSTRALFTRGASSVFQQANVTARGDLAFFTDALTTALYRVRLSDPNRTIETISQLSGGDVRLTPRALLSGTTFGSPRGLTFTSDGTLYLADVQRNAVYAIAPQNNGEVGAASHAEIAVGDGASVFLPMLGETYPGAALSIREPLGLAASDDGFVFVLTAYGVYSFDTISREAAAVAYYAGLDEITCNPAGTWVSAVALSSTSLAMELPCGNTHFGRIDIDRFSSEFEPTRTLQLLSGGATQLTDTRQALVEKFDAAGRIIEKRKRTGELDLAFSYADAQSDKLDHLTDPVGGTIAFGYDGSGRLASITDPRGRATSVTVDGSGDLVTFQLPDLETYHLTYSAHRLTQKQNPRDELTTHTFNPNGTIASATKPGGATTLFDAALAHAATYSASGALVRSGAYTDAHGVAHAIEINRRGHVEKDSYTADGVARVEQLVYATSDKIGPFPGTNNTILRVANKTLNGVNTMPRQVAWDDRFRLLREFPEYSGDADSHDWVYRADGWLDYEYTGAATARIYERDSSGHVTRTYEGSGGPPNWTSTGNETLYTYRADGQPATMTDHGIVRTYSYDDAGGTTNELGWTDNAAPNRSMTYSRDSYGNIIATNDGTASTAATYDVRNRLVSSRDALGNETTYGYAFAGCGCSFENLVTSIHTPDLPAGVDWTMTMTPTVASRRSRTPTGSRRATTTRPRAS